ncbi:MAG: hypothetical protein VB078_07310 [Clostridiaceae bacterium]|nr:hypothetical protein [Clostridiaceae bacterium]
MGAKLIMATIIAFMFAFVVLSAIAVVIKAAASRSIHNAEIYLILKPLEECDTQRLLDCAYYVKEKIFPQMVIELAEGIDTDKRYSGFDNLPQ